MATERRGRRALFAGTLVGALLIGAGATLAMTRHTAQPAASSPPPLDTATVTRTTLVNNQQEPGTLGYAGSYTLVGQSATTGGSGTGGSGAGGSGTGGSGGGGGSSTLTWLPATGTEIKEGGQLYGVNGHPVPLLYGSAPLYRTLSAGVSDGADVAELNQSLRALGYRSAPSGEAFTSGTVQAVKDWQKALGVSRTGTVSPGDAVFEPGPVIVTSVSANLGAPASGSLMTLSGTTKIVTVNLPATARTLATVGATVRIQLPDNSTTTGHVTSIGTVATNGNDSGSGSGSGSGQGGSGSGSGSGSGGNGSGPTVPVTVSLDHPEAVGDLDGAPVSVSFTSATQANVLAVPVGALLALAEGGYAIEVVDPSRHTRLVAVQLGMFANGLVQISGPGVREGLTVEVASTE